MEPIESICGRRREQETLERVVRSREAEFVAVYGRRRVGKTHLVREFCKSRTCYLEITGEHGSPLKTQLYHFRRELERVFYGGAPLPELRSWREAFEVAIRAIEHWVRDHPERPIVLFLDELPWLATRRGGLIPALDHAWNTRLVQINQVRMIVCGSAASWMLDNLIHAKGGLYNRITERIRLEPFTLAETKTFLSSRSVKLGNRQIIDLYIALGGIPHYLKRVKRGQSAAQSVADICFDPGGILHDEFRHLFRSLFSNAEAHEAIVRALASKRSGLLRSELLEVTGFSSGGRLRRWLFELEESGFVFRDLPFRRKERDAVYRLSDEYVSFFLSWVDPAPRATVARDAAKYWQAKSQQPAYNAWAGYAFEGICLKHVPEISRALGIAHLGAEVASWRFVPRAGSPENGAQIDMLFDRPDGVVSVCELKFAQDGFVISKSYARKLRRKLEVFAAKTKTKKDVKLIIVAPCGLKANAWSDEMVDGVVTADDLFR